MTRAISPNNEPLVLSLDNDGFFGYGTTVKRGGDHLASPLTPKAIPLTSKTRLDKKKVQKQTKAGNKDSLFSTGLMSSPYDYSSTGFEAMHKALKDFSLH